MAGPTLSHMRGSCWAEVGWSLEGKEKQSARKPGGMLGCWKVLPGQVDGWKRDRTGSQLPVPGIFICIIIASSCSNPDCDRSKVTFPEVRSKDRRSGWLVGVPLGREGAGVEAARVSGLQSPSRCWSLQVMAAPQAHDLLPQPRSLSAALGQPRSPSDACSPFLAQRQGSPHQMPPGL